MNQTFEANRLVLLIKKHWAENKRRYGLAVVALMGLWIIWFTFILLVSGESMYPLAPAVQQMTYYFTLFTVGSFYASQFFRDFASKSKTADFLLVPASALEKLICGLLFVLPLFFIVFTLCFYVADVLMVTVANIVHPAYAGDKSEQVANVFTSYGIPEGAVPYLLLIFVAIVSWYLLGSAYFSKYALVKTAIAQFAGFIFIMLFLAFLNDLMPDGGFDTINGQLSYRIFEGDVTDQAVQLPYWVTRLLQIVVLYCIAPVLWFVTYLRLKEKEV